MANPAHIDVVADPRPGSRGYLKWYWTKGPGLAKWRLSPHPWTALRRHLLGKVPAAYLDETVSQWFHDVFGYWPAERRGKNPVGKG
jgi:hypothetical protein